MYEFTPSITTSPPQMCVHVYAPTVTLLQYHGFYTGKLIEIVNSWKGKE